MGAAGVNQQIMRFMPQTETDIAAMLETVGAKRLDDLIAHVPADLRATATINLDPGRAESDVVDEISKLAARNTGARKSMVKLLSRAMRHWRRERSTPAPCRSTCALVARDDTAGTLFR